jgi:hypothetical protein
MYQAKNELVRGRQLKAQRLVIPFTITASATASAVVLRNDEPGVLFLKSEGVDQITAQLAAGETATYSVSPVDANGTLNMYIDLRDEDCVKVLAANVVDRLAGGSQPCKLGDADGISSTGNIMLTMDSTVDHTAANFDGCLIVDYVVE